MSLTYRVFIFNLQFEGVKADILRFLTEYCRDDIDKNIARYTKVIKVFFLTYSLKCFQLKESNELDFTSVNTTNGYFL